jgi:hypothetical protein
MKVGDLIRVLPRRDDGIEFPAIRDRLGVIIAQDCHGQHIMMMDGSKVWLQTKRLEVQSESR